MKKILLLCLLVSMIGCAQTKIVKVPVFSPLEFTMPERPKLTCDGKGSYDDVSKQIEKDMIDLQRYAKELENTLKVLKSKDSN